MTKSRGSKNSVVDVVRELAKRKSKSMELRWRLWRAEKTWRDKASEVNMVEPPCFATKKVGHHHMDGFSCRCFALLVEMSISLSNLSVVCVHGNEFVSKEFMGVLMGFECLMWV